MIRMMRLPQFSLRILFFAIAVFAVSFAFEREHWVKYSDQLAYEKYCQKRIKLDASRGTISAERYQADTAKDQRTMVEAISRPAAGRQAYKMTGHDRTATQKPLAPI